MRRNGIFLAVAAVCLGGAAWADATDEREEAEAKTPRHNVTLSVPME